MAAGSHEVERRPAFLRFPQVSIISLTFLKYVQERWLNLQPFNGDYSPSSGLMALLYALHTCDQARYLVQLTDFHPSATKKNK